MKREEFDACRAEVMHLMACLYGAENVPELAKETAWRKSLADRLRSEVEHFLAAAEPEGGEEDGK